MTLRLLFVTQTFPRDANDTAGPFIAELARALVRAGDSVTVLVPHARGVGDCWQDRGVEVRSFRYAPQALEVIGYGRSLRADEKLRSGASVAAPLYVAGVRRALRRELGRRRYDWAHLHWIVPNGFAVPPAVPGGPRLAFGLHGSDVFLAEKRWLGPWVRRMLRVCSLVTGCSPELVDRVRALDPRSRAGDRPQSGPLWRVIPYGVDVEIFRPGEGAAGGWRSELGIRESEVMVLGLGRMATKKGFHLLTPALGPLLERRPEVQVVLAGGGDLEPGLRAAAAAWSGRVHVLGTVSRDRIADLYRAADLFVLPAIHDSRGNVDGLPNVILEAMASGLPVVASDLSGIPLAVRHGREGLLVPEGDAAAAVAALDRLVSSPQERGRMGAAARERVESELTWDQIAARYRDAYLEAEHRRAATRAG